MAKRTVVPRFHRRRTALSAAALGSMLAALAGVILSARYASVEFYWSDAALAGTYSLVGGYVAWHRPRHPIGWLLILIAASGALGALGPELGRLATSADSPLSSALGWLCAWVWWPAYGSLPLLGLLFPDGRLPSSRWRAVAALSWAVLLVPLLVLMVGGALDPSAGLMDPEHIENTWLGRVNAPAFLSLMACGPLVMLALIQRWRHGDPTLRRQLAWLLWALTIDLAFDLGSTTLWGLGWDGAPTLILVLSIGFDTLIPAAIAIAVLRYRLYAIDVVVQRSLIGSALTGLVILLYVTSTVVAGRFVASVVTAIAIAIGFAPIQQRLRSALGRALYGERGDPAAVVARVQERINRIQDPGEMLPVLSEALADSMKLPFVAIEPATGPAARQGSPVEPVEVRDLLHGGVVVGRLLVSARGFRDPLAPVDHQTLRQVLPVAAACVHGVSLSSALRRSRDHVVRAREEERRRLRRDLHDGIGSALTGLGMGIEAARLATDRGDLSTARRGLRVSSEMIPQVRDELERIVEDLGPALLDLGLVHALRQQWHRTGLPDGLSISIRATPEVNGLPAAIETAAYRIANEAVTNVVRHAGATRCGIELDLDDATVLHLTVTDNGGGRAAGADGVGTASMRERASEVGGFVTVRDIDPGTAVHAALPLRSVFA